MPPAFTFVLIFILVLLLLDLTLNIAPAHTTSSALRLTNAAQLYRRERDGESLTRRKYFVRAKVGRRTRLGVYSTKRPRFEYLDALKCRTHNAPQLAAVNAVRLQRWPPTS